MSCDLCEKLLVKLRRAKSKVIVGGIYSQPTSSSSPAPPPTKGGPGPGAPQRPCRNAHAPTPQARAAPRRGRCARPRPVRAAAMSWRAPSGPAVTNVVCGYGYNGGLAMTTHASRNGEASLQSSPEYLPNPPRAPRARKDRCGVFDLMLMFVPSSVYPIHFSMCRVARADSRPRLAEPRDGALRCDGDILACSGLPKGDLHSCQSIPHASGTPRRCTSMASAKGLQFRGVCCW